MGTLYPAQADDNTSLPNPGGSDNTENSNALLKHDYQHDTVNDAIKAIEAKLGIGASTPGIDGQLLCVVAGKTIWQNYAVGGDLSGTLPNPTLKNIAGVAGSYGSNTKVPVITIDNKGRITAVSEVTIIGGGGGGGALSPLTTKGDIWVYGAGDTRLGVGSNGQILTADSTAPNGIKWAAAPAAGVWGQITGLLSDQVDLANALAAKVNNTTYNALVASLSTAAFSGSYTDLLNKPTLSTVAGTGSYNDLLNKPSIPAAQVNSDWNASSGAAQILNKPDLTVYMPKAGGTFTGAIVLAADPTANLQPATKQYVDNKTTTSLIRNETPGGSINGSNTAYTTASTFATGSLKVYLNGQRLTPGSGNDYVEATQGFTMQYAPATGDILLVDYETTNTAFIQGSNSIVVQETPSGSVNGSNTAFTTLLGKYVANTLEVYVNGLQQIKTTDYVETTPGSGIFTFTTAPLTGDIVRITYQFSTGASGNADTVDGIHASTTPAANTLYPLNASGIFPSSVIQSSVLGYAQILAAVNTTSASAVQATGLTASVTIPTLQGNQRIEVEFFCRDVYNATAGKSVTISLWEGTVGSGTQIAEAKADQPSSAAVPISCKASYTPSAGAKTYNVGCFSTSGGTAVIEAAANAAAFIQVKIV